MYNIRKKDGGRHVEILQYLQYFSPTPNQVNPMKHKTEPEYLLKLRIPTTNRYSQHITLFPMTREKGLTLMS